MDESHVLFVIAHNNFNYNEYAMPKKMINDAGFAVVTASDRSGIAIAQNGSTVHVDITLDKVHTSNYSGVFFVGGEDALEHLDNHTSYKIIQEAIQHNIPVGAICIATRILAKAEILTNKQATGWDGDGQLQALFKEYYVHYVATQAVVVDDNIITATDPSAAQEFGKQIVHILQKKQSWG